MKRSRATIGLMRIWLALTCGLVPADFARAQGTIVYHQPPVPINPLPGQNLDLDGDGQTDLHFYAGAVLQANYYFTSASGVGSARLLVSPLAGVDGGSHLIALGAGSEIGNATNNAVVWAAQDAPNNYGQPTVLGAYIPEDAGGSLVPVGYFYNTTGYMGIQFQIGSDWHYGWVRIRGGAAGVGDDGQFHLNPPGWVLDWAYETRADTPIFAGAGVPEPSTLSLIGIGALALAVARRSHSKS
jgi:hypothetical protein